MAVTQAQLQQLYLAYFGRPADFDGLVYYTSQPNLSIWDVAAAFSASPESQALYGPGFNASVINAIYQNLFNRDAEPAGLLYWSQQVASGALSPAGAALGILLGAQNADADAVANKLAVADLFTNHLDTAAEIIGYTGDDAAAAARAFLHTVTSDSATVLAAAANVDAAIAGVVAVGGNIGATVTLTANADAPDFTHNITTIDTVKGVVDPTGGKSTFSVGDVIEGNGKTVVDLAVASGGTADFVSLHNVKAVNITNGAGNDTVTFHALDWTGVGSINLNNGAGDLTVFVDGIDESVGLSIANVTGTISATYSSGLYAQLEIDAGKASLSNVGGSIVGQYLTADASFSYSQGYTSSAGTSNAQTIGSVTVSGTGTDGQVSIWNGADKGADITVGNVSMIGATDQYFYIYNGWNSNRHSVSSDAVNTTVGNITITGTGTGGDASAEVEQFGDLTVGDLMVGNVALTNNAKNSDWTYFSAENFARAGGAGDANGSSAAAGNVKVGTITLSASGASANHVSAYVTNYASASGSGSATVGTTTVGNVSVVVGMTGNGEVSVSAHASAQTSGTATIGNVSVGSVNVTVGQSSVYNVYDNVVANAAGGATATIGNVDIGAISFSGVLDADLQSKVVVAANTTGTAVIGDVTTGGVTAVVGVDATLSITTSVNANGSSGSSVGNVSVGSVGVTSDDGAFSKVKAAIMTAGTLSDVTLGAQSITLGVSATAALSNDIVGGAGMGTVSVGNISLNGAKQNDKFGGHLVVNGGTGDIAGVTIGTVSLSSGKQTVATQTNAFVAVVTGAGGTIGDVAMGNVTISSADKSKTNLVLVNNGTGDLGNTTVGTVSLTSTGTGSQAQFVVVETSGATGGDLTVGNVSMTLGSAKGVGSAAKFTAVNGLGDTTVGDITLTGSAVRTTTDTTVAYAATLNIHGDNVKVGNITVKGGDATADNFAVFKTLMAGVAGTTTTTIGNVDYSAYGAAATIDVSGFKGAASITGSAGKDTITDNKGTSTITGGASADTFSFVDQTNLTAAKADTITDFNNAGGDKIKTNAGAQTAATYGENTFADFASFLTGAGAANKEIFVGQIGSDLYVAVDSTDGTTPGTSDGTVDYVIKLSGLNLSQIDVASFI